METITNMEQVAERFEAIAMRMSDVRLARVELVQELRTLMQRARDVSVAAGDEQNKRYIVGCLKWVLDDIDAKAESSL